MAQSDKHEIQHEPTRAAVAIDERVDAFEVRLDSQGVARVKQKLPANRNPFSWSEAHYLGPLHPASPRVLAVLSEVYVVA